MKEPTFNGRELLPLSVMEAAHAGDAMAMEQVLRYYEDYINKLCIRTLYDSNGIPYVCVGGRILVRRRRGAGDTGSDKRRGHLCTETPPEP